MKNVFCPTYTDIFFALHLKNSGHEVRVITDNASVEKYCRAAALDSVYFDYINVTTTRFYRIIILRNRINILIEKLAINDNNDFYLMDNAFDLAAFYLAKEWAKKGPVYFNLLGFAFNDYSERNYFSFSFLARTNLRWLCKIFLGLDLTFREMNASPIFGIGDKFLDKNMIRKFSLDKTVREMKLEAMRKNPVRLKEYDNLFITDGDLSGRVDETSLTAMCGNLLKLPYEFAVKYHPRVGKSQKLTGYEAVFRNCVQLPDYIPVELLLDNVKNNVIAISSSSLVLASQLESLKAISVLDLVQWRRQSYKEEVKTWLVKESNNRIIFVKTFAELTKLLEAKG